MVAPFFCLGFTLQTGLIGLFVRFNLPYHLTDARLHIFAFFFESGELRYPVSSRRNCPVAELLYIRVGHGPFFFFWGGGASVVSAVAEDKV